MTQKLKAKSNIKHRKGQLIAQNKTVVVKLRTKKTTM